MKKELLLGISVIAFAAYALSYDGCNQSPQAVEEIKRDTIRLIDTVFLTKTVIKKGDVTYIPFETRIIDSIKTIAYKDTGSVKYINLPIQNKEQEFSFLENNVVGKIKIKTAGELLGLEIFDVVAPSCPAPIKCPEKPKTFFGKLKYILTK